MHYSAFFQKIISEKCEKEKKEKKSEIKIEKIWIKSKITIRENIISQINDIHLFILSFIYWNEKKNRIRVEI